MKSTISNRIEVSKIFNNYYVFYIISFTTYPNQVPSQPPTHNQFLSPWLKKIIKESQLLNIGSIRYFS